MSVFNYADDITVSVCGVKITGVDSNLAKLSRVLIEWFTQILMQANASKYQYIMFISSLEYLEFSRVPGMINYT